MKKILPTNYVMIKPDRPIESDKTGLARHDFVDSHMQLAVSGTIKAVCDDLWFYNGEEPDLVQESLEFETEIEVKPGDRVLFRYLATIDKDYQLDGYYLVRYDDLFCRIDGKRLVPVNGYLFVGVGADKRTVGGINANPAYIAASQTIGRVLAAGTPLTCYRDYPGEFDTDFSSVVGKKVVYKKNTAVRLEVDDFAQFSTGPFSIYRLHWRNVRLIL